ncbi:MAG: yceI [Mycobacterium sp.]|nr:yceI [Mycobacterium sp.]
MTDMASFPLHDWVGSWQVDPDRSAATVRCKTMWGLATVKGTFSNLTGACEVTESGASGDVRVPVNTLTTGIAKRDAHLRGPEFFDVERFPDITAAVTAVDPKGPDTAEVHARLSIKGTTRAIDPLASVAELADGAVRVTASLVMNRHDFGVDGNVLGMVGDDATVSADVVFVRSDRT